MPSNSSQGDNIYTYHISNIKINSHEDNKFGNINELIKEVPNDIYADINEMGGLFTDVTNIEPCNDRRDYQIEHKTSNERMEMPLKDNSISDVNDSFFVRPIKVENIHEIPEINVGTGTSINEDIKMPIAQNNPLSTLSYINNPHSTLSSSNNPLSTLSSIKHPTSILSSTNHPTSKLSSINNPPSSMASSKHQLSTLSSTNHPTSTLSSDNHPTSTVSSVSHPTSTLSSVSHPTSTLSSVNHPTTTLSSINNPPSSLSSSKHQPSTMSSVNHPTSTLSSVNHPTSTLSSVNHPTSSMSSSNHQPSTLSSVNHPTSSMSSSNHQPSTLPSINQSPWISSFFPIVYTTRINDMTLSIRNIEHVRGKTKILSIYHQSKPKFKSVYSIFNCGNIYAIPKTKGPVRTYSRFKQKSEASENVADQSLNRFEVSRDAKVDSGEGTSTENNIEQVKDIISPVNSTESLSKTRKKQISESSKTKLNSKIFVHEPNLPEKKNGTRESVLLQLNETDCDIIESDRELDQMISAILDNSLATDVQSNSKQSYEENKYNDEICCWYKREQIANNLSNTGARSNVVRSYHKCATSNCTCCCKPNEENLIITPAPLCSRRTSTFNIHHIKTGIQELEPTTTEHYTDVNSSESNMNNEIDKIMNLKVEENIIDVNSPVIQSLEALRDVHFTFNSEGKLVANLASSITYYEAPTLHVLERIFSVVNDQIAAHGLSPRDKISILLHNVMDKIKLDVHSNTATSTNNETTSKTMDQSVRLLPNLNKEQTKIDGINEHTDESTDFDKAKYSFMTKDKTIMPESSSKHPSTVSNIATKPYIDAIESLFRRDKKSNNKQCLHIIETDNTDVITAHSKLNVIADKKKVKRKLETKVAPRKMMCIKSDVKP